MDLLKGEICLRVRGVGESCSRAVLWKRRPPDSLVTLPFLLFSPEKVITRRAREHLQEGGKFRHHLALDLSIRSLLTFMMGLGLF